MGVRACWQRILLTLTITASKAENKRLYSLSPELKVARIGGL